MTLTILADENMPGLEPLERLVQLRRLPGRHLRSTDLEQVDALLIRSVTRVDETLLTGTAVRFVGSATIGSDHLDLGWLQRHGITVALAPGCNAMAVAEYVLQAVLRWSLEQGVSLTGRRAGVLGYGQVGRRVARLLQALGMQVVVRDPPLRAQGVAVPYEDFNGEDLATLDVISLHVPLVRQGPWPTHHWLAAADLASLNERQLLINTCRGEVLENFAQVPIRARLVMDVWPEEPWVSESHLERVWLGSPHVAGYSVQGKLRGTAAVLAALDTWYSDQTGQQLLPADALAVVPVDGEWHHPVDSAQALLALLESRFDLRRDHQALNSMVRDNPSREARQAAFDALRRHYPARHEVSGLRLQAGGREPWLSVCRLLGLVF